jgi:hypothetical protein
MIYNQGNQFFYMQEETLTFEEIEELKAREAEGVFVPHDVMKAYFTIKNFLEAKDVTNI